MGFTVSKGAINVHRVNAKVESHPASSGLVRCLVRRPTTHIRALFELGEQLLRSHRQDRFMDFYANPKSRPGLARS